MLRDEMKVALKLLMLLLLTGCGNKVELGKAPVPENYLEELEAYYATRLTSLTNEQGWMRLAGMYWLEEGESTFGSSPENDVVFPEGFISARTGKFILEGDSVRMLILDGTEVFVEDQKVTDKIIFTESEAPVINHGHLNWVVIKRGDLIGIRLYNAFNPEVDDFEGFERYPVSHDFNLLARFVLHPQPQTVRIINILDQEEDVNSPGILEFEIEGQVYSLIGLEASNNRMFVIFGDRTNRTETYQAGRFIYVDIPQGNEKTTILDFNRAYNPPCSYSPYTTCQLPPPQNQLPIEIRAGEKRP